MATRTNVRALREDTDFDSLLQEYRPFITSCVYRTLGKSVEEDLDGAMRIASDAFAEAARSYTPRDGRFLGFAENAIYARLTETLREEAQVTAFDDYIKKIDPAYSAAEAMEQQIVDVDALFCSEVEALSGKLGGIGITFRDVSEASPRSSRKKQACATVARTLYRHPELYDMFRENGRMPGQELERITEVDERLINRYRLYILFLAEILLGGHVHIAEFIKYGAEG